MSVAVVVSVSILIRAALFAFPYSGEHTPPTYGDFEAQRHWLEITVNTPLEDWYRNTTDNDLSYWGLDYPPLTAYHSYVLGRIAQVITPESVTLHESRGNESKATKLFMRMTVLLSELFVYFPAAVVFSLGVKRNRVHRLFVLLLCPAILLIDHGHFQYNTVCLGLVLWSMVLHHLPILCASAFMLAVLYKQMALYYAPGIFLFLLMTYARKPTVIGKLAFSVVFTTTAVLFPFRNVMFHVISRVFPFQRGVYEDKVANLWCVSSIFIKWRNWPIEAMVRIALITTLASLIPLVILSLVYLRSWDVSRSLFQQKIVFICFMAISSLSFYLFSYHVHEKSILFPLVPILCLLNHMPRSSSAIILTSTFSLFPLLQRDELLHPYFVFQILSVLAFYWRGIDMKLTGSVAVLITAIHSVYPFLRGWYPQYPHLNELLVASVSFVVLFCQLFYLYFWTLKFILYKPTLSKLKQH